MNTLLNQIRGWAATELRYWERAALEKVANRSSLSTDDYQELVRYFIEDAGLAPTPSDRPRLVFPESAVEEVDPERCRLNRIFELSNVNALPEGQEISFGPELTLVYGNNGVGKSGYARVLGSAGFARGKRQVLPNAIGPASKNTPKAKIEISCSDAKQVVTWIEGERCPELSGFYLFDGDSMSAHLTDANSLSFSPGGLFLLTQLADVTDEVRERIRAMIAKRDAPHSFLFLFEGESKVKGQVAELLALSHLEQLRKLAELSVEEEKEIGHLEKSIAELRLLNIPKQIEKRSREIRDLESLIEAISRAQASLGDTAETATTTLINEIRDRRAKAESLGVDQFRFQAFTQVGSTIWREFLTAAKALADAEASPNSPYPSVDDHCLLCRQVLSREAADFIQKLWEFLKSDDQARLEGAANAISEKIRELERINLNYFAADSSARRLLNEELQIVVPALEAQIQACIARREELLDSLRSGTGRTPPPLISFDTTDIKQIVSIRREEIGQLEKSDTAKRLAEAEQSLRELKHRKILGQRLPEIGLYIEGKKWAVQARQSLGSTRMITTKFNELFEQLVTERYRKLFEETLKLFRENINVTIETRGFKGETVRQLVLTPERFRAGFSVNQILCDGEKRAVAMADFLTEVALDRQSNGIILDDPVTSLDNTWKNTLARCLVTYAKTRQVVILTHDLTFLYQINTHAEELSVNLVSHWLRDEDGRPGYVYLDNSPVCEKDYKSSKKALELYAAAKDAPPARQQVLLQQGFGALRTSYEALIIFDIFNEVVARFEERISFGRLSDVRIDPNLADELIKRMEFVSRYIDAHLHSDNFSSTKPTPANLLQEIQAFESIRQRQKQLKKSPIVSPASPPPV
jgi:hypothetical protein